MKKITDILEKLKVDDIKISYKFPINQSIEKWADFLEKNDFVKLDSSSKADGSDQVVQLLNDVHGRAFYIGKNNDYIYLADTSESDIDEKKNHYYFYSNRYNMFSEDSYTISRGMFMKAICDKFGFEL